MSLAVLQPFTKCRAKVSTLFTSLMSWHDSCSSIAPFNSFTDSIYTSLKWPQAVLPLACCSVLAIGHLLINPLKYQVVFPLHCLLPQLHVSFTCLSYFVRSIFIPYFSCFTIFQFLSSNSNHSADFCGFKKLPLWIFCGWLLCLSRHFSTLPTKSF